jgi:hypothetical protein
MLDYMIAMIAHPHFRLNLVKEYLNVVLGERERERGEQRREAGELGRNFQFKFTVVV